MSPQQRAEIEFWASEFRSYPSAADYVAIRTGRDLEIESQYLPEIHQEIGKGLDLACGLVSVIEGLRQEPEIVAIDGLHDAYDAIYRPAPRPGFRYQQGDGERMSEFADGEFDFVWCNNAIDHTPNPTRMLSEIRRVLKPGGRLYFWVNFDPALFGPHYKIWNMQMVDAQMQAFHLVRGTLYWNAQHKKHIWSALYERPA